MSTFQFIPIGNVNMPSCEIMIAFFLATAVFAYMPGPSTMYAAAQKIARGRRAGWMASLGIHAGGYVHVAAAALGLAILFTTVPLLYTVLKFAGVECPPKSGPRGGI